MSAAVYESWARCQRFHASPAEKVEFEPVSTSRTHLALQKHRDLMTAWLDELPQLQAVLGTTSCAAMLTDPTGVLIGATCVGRAHEMLMPIATRTGVNLCEEAVGTTAPGVAARTGQAVSVFAGEHFFDSVKEMHCAAAPIRDTHGRVAGVLDISSEAIPFRFEASIVVGLYAAGIENRLLISQSADHLVVRFQVDAKLLDSHFAALVGIDRKGELAWMNGTAARLLGLPSTPGAHDERISAEAGMGASFSRLASLPETDSAFLLLSNGLMVWARAQMRALDGHRNLVQGWQDAALTVMPREVEAIAPANAGGAASEQVPGDATVGIDRPKPRRNSRQAGDESPDVDLRDCSKHLIEQALDRYGGNVAKAARKLGVSRGLIYRRLGRQQ
ncbi:helix-turn-helix domain-containing protein [Variovorax sp. GT1P44]|uniref:helix-turn-helix domain-containing protein n=1 Tax=Variovorax sp. GT1P44 TaxID=3443742 RepID=UPI003F47343A